MEYRRINAFTSEGSTGNPAACYFLGDRQLTHEEMLAIGKEHAGIVSEVVFVNDTPNADCKLTYYSSECEVDFCGHGTIATMYEYIRSRAELMAKPEILIETNRSGSLKVYNCISEEDTVYISAPKGGEHNMPMPEKELLDIMGVKKEMLDDRYPIELFEAGLKTIIVPLANLADEISLWPSETVLKDFALKHGFDNILIFSKHTANEKYIAHTRVFAPKFGYLEDPATGSSNSAFAMYMLKHNIWDGTPASIEQGGEDRVFNAVRIMTKGDDILFGGSCLVVTI